jgi:hypothetical protein
MRQINWRNVCRMASHRISNIQLYKIDRTLFKKQPWVQIHAQKTCHLKQNVTLLSVSVDLRHIADEKALIIENFVNLSFMFGEASEYLKNKHCHPCFCLDLTV